MVSFSNEDENYADNFNSQYKVISLSLTIMHNEIIENDTEASFTAVFQAFVASVMNWLDNLMGFIPSNEHENLVSVAKTAFVTISSDIDKLLST